MHEVPCYVCTSAHSHAWNTHCVGILIGQHEATKVRTSESPVPLSSTFCFCVRASTRYFHLPVLIVSAAAGQMMVELLTPEDSVSISLITKTTVSTHPTEISNSRRRLPPESRFTGSQAHPGKKGLRSSQHAYLGGRQGKLDFP